MFIPLSMYFQERLTHLNCISDHPKFRFINSKLAEPKEITAKFKATVTIDSQEREIVGDLKVHSYARTSFGDVNYVSLQIFLEEWHFVAGVEDTSGYCNDTGWFRSSRAEPKAFEFTVNNRRFTHSRLLKELEITDKLCKLGADTHCQYLSALLKAKPPRKRNAVWRDQAQHMAAKQRYQDAKDQFKQRFIQRVSNYEH